MQIGLFAVPGIIVAVLSTTSVLASSDNAASIVGALDTAYQSAVEHNDWQAMDRILHPDFVLVLGDGTKFTRAQLIDSSRNGKVLFEKQVEIPGTQVVRLFGKDTATVSALLWLKGKRADAETTFDFKVWFTDTYVRTSDGWRYAFGQAGTPMPVPKDSKD